MTKVYCGVCAALVMEVLPNRGLIEKGPTYQDTLQNLFGENYCSCEKRNANEFLRAQNAVLSEQGAILLSDLSSADRMARLARPYKIG